MDVEHGFSLWINAWKLHKLRILSGKMNMDISVLITLNQLLEVFFSEIKFSKKKKKKKIVTKRRLLLQVHFVLLILFVLPMGS